MSQEEAEELLRKDMEAEGQELQKNTRPYRLG
jgi:hypothetical protein